MANGVWWVAAWVCLAVAVAAVEALMRAVARLAEGKVQPSKDEEERREPANRQEPPGIMETGITYSGLKADEYGNPYVTVTVNTAVFIELRRQEVAKGYGAWMKGCWEYRTDLELDTFERVRRSDRKCSMTWSELMAWSYPYVGSAEVREDLIRGWN